MQRNYHSIGDSSDMALTEQKPSLLSKAWGSIKKASKFALTLIIISPSAVNAAASVTDADPKIMGLTWFNSLSRSNYWATIGYFFASLAVNIPVMYSYAPKALEKFKLSFNAFTSSIQKLKTATTPEERWKHRKEILKHIGIFLTGASAALATGAIAFDAFTWAGELIALSVSVFNTTVYFATRYVGVKNFVNWVNGRRDPELQLNKAAIDVLRRINENHLDEINELINTIITKHKELTPIAIEEIFSRLENKVNDNNEILDPENPNLEKLGLAFDVAFGLAVFIPAWYTFIEKGFGGENIAAKYAGHPMDDTHRAVKLALGLIPGTASAMLYFINVFNYRQIAVDIWNEVSYEPISKIPQIIYNLLWLGINYPASGSMQNVVRNIEKKGDAQIIPVALDSDVGNAFAWLVQAGAYATNAAPCHQKFSGNGEKNDRDTVIKYLAAKDIEDMPKQEATSMALSRLSLFSEKHNDVTILIDNRNNYLPQSGIV